MADGSMSKSELIGVAEKNLKRLLEWVGRLDSKIAIILGIDTGMLGLLLSLAPGKATWTPSSMWTTIGALLLLFLSLLFVYLAGLPRTKGPSQSLLFFCSIASKSFSEYRQACLSLTEAKYLEDLLEQCHRNSEIVDWKFKCLEWAYRSLAVATIPWAVSIFLFKYGR